MNILGVIPARFSSTRFPGKPLALIGDKPMIQHVYERCQESNCFSKIIVATDDERIYKAVQSFGAEVVMTSEAHQSGTDRCFEVLENIADLFDGVINIQGDEPFISPKAIVKVAELLQEKASIATLGVQIKTADYLFDANKVKIVLNSLKEALYFSRAAIPYQRDAEKSDWLKNQEYYLHLGIYGFSLETIQKIKTLQPSKLEQLECLEQLRWLEAGHKIRVGIVDEIPQGVDTPEDLEKLMF